MQLEVGEVRRHAAIALTDGEVLVASLSRLAAMLESDTLFGQEFCRRMMLAHESSFIHPVKTSHGHARERLAYLVVELFLRIRHRLPASAGETLHWPLTQEIMGAAVGVTHEHVNRVLRQFREEEVLLLSNKRTDNSGP